MSVYVDEPIYPYGRMMMCHMVADSTEELLAMVDAIGVQRKWIQKAGTHREHFDICKAKRERAIRCGAVEVDSVGPILREKRKPRCEGCGKRPTREDSDGVPLCDACYEALPDA